MKHLSIALIRRALDDPHVLDDAARQHLDSCAQCRTVAGTVSADAAHTRALLADFGPAVAPEKAYARLRQAGLSAVPPKPRPFSMRPAAGSRLRAPVLAAMLGLGLVGALVGTGVAGDLVKIFEPEQVVAVPVSTNSLGSLPDLSAYGTVKIVKEPEFADASSLSEAAEQTGLDLLTPGTLAGVEGESTFHTATSGSASFTFDKDKAAAATGGRGIPSNLHGSSLFISGGPVAIQVIGEPSKEEIEALAKAGGSGQVEIGRLLPHLPSLVIVQMKAPSVSSDGPSVSDYEQALLDLPGLPEDLKAGIRAIGDPSSTLPVPVPTSLAVSHPVEINGADGLAIGDNTGIGSGVVWQSDGMVHAVGGTLRESQVLEIARSMK
jgi:hypothetical protein